MRVGNNILPSRTNFISNNIDVDPNIICHAEQSEASIFNAILRSFTLTLAPSGVDRWFIQDDKFAKKNNSRVNCYIIAILFI